MTYDITLNFSDQKNVSGKISVENPNIIKNIFPEYDAEVGITQAQFRQLQEIATYSGEAEILENADFSNGKNRLKLDLIKGKASCQGKLMGLLCGGGYASYIYINVPVGTSMQAIKDRYNLPEGALRNYCKQAGANGDMDNFKTIANQVWFTVDAFAKGNNMTVEEVEALFK